MRQVLPLLMLMGCSPNRYEAARSACIDGMSRACEQQLNADLGIQEDRGADAFRSSARFMFLWDLEGWDHGLRCPSDWAPEACFYEWLVEYVEESESSNHIPNISLRLRGHRFRWGYLFREDDGLSEFRARYFIFATRGEESGLEAVEAMIDNCDPDQLTCWLWEDWIDFYRENT